MSALTHLIDTLKSATVGSHELDQLVIDYVSPGQRLGGRSHKYTRSIDAKLPGENVVSVQRLQRIKETWRVQLANGWSAEGHTEALARRLAVLTFEHFDQVNDMPRHRPLLKTVWREDRLRRKRRKLDLENDPEGLLPMIPEPANEDERIISLVCEALRRNAGETAPPGQSWPEIAGDQFGNTSVRIVSGGKRHLTPTKAGRAARWRLSQVFAMWREEATPLVKNIERVGRSVRRFISHAGDRPLNRYSKTQVRSFLRALAGVPVCVPKTVSKKPLSAILCYAKEHPKLRRITPATIKCYLKDIHMIFNWAMALELCAANPAYSLRVADHRNKSQLRTVYDIEDLKLIFERSPQYAGCLKPNRRKQPGAMIIKDSLFWVPLIALFTGARTAEIANAAPDDFKTDGPVYYLEIRAAENRQLKTQSSARCVPIHKELVRMGLKAYIETQREAHRERVFTHVDGQRDIQRVDGWTQMWRSFQDSIGLADRRKVFHSFRHTFKRACREAHIPEEVHDLMTGHRPAGSGRRYGAGVSLRRLNRAMQCVRFEGLDLSPLYTPEASPL